MYRSSRLRRSISARRARSPTRRVSILSESERDPLPGIQPPWLGATPEVDQRVRRHLESGDLLADPLDPRFQPSALAPEVGQRAVELVHPASPLLPLLDVEQDGLGIDHAGSEEPGSRINLSLDVPTPSPRCRGERLKVGSG